MDKECFLLHRRFLDHIIGKWDAQVGIEVLADTETRPVANICLVREGSGGTEGEGNQPGSSAHGRVPDGANRSADNTDDRDRDDEQGDAKEAPVLSVAHPEVQKRFRNGKEFKGIR